MSMLRSQRPGRLAGLVFAVLLTAALGASVEVPAAGATPHATCEHEAQLRDGVQAFEQEQYDAATSALQTVLQAEPGCLSSEWGSAAYWMGRLLAMRDANDAALKVWKDGLEVLENEQAHDLRMADAYLSLLAVKGYQRAATEATQTYDDIIRRVGSDVAAWEEPILQRTVARIKPLLPAALFEQVVINDDERHADEWHFTNGAGDLIELWWHRQDPIPATEKNERMVEHLTRVHYAVDNYGVDDLATGYDDRGTIYVKYGQPIRIRSVTFNDAEFLKGATRFGSNVQAGSFPKNEIWSYQHIDWTGAYLFVQNQDHYFLGETLDLLPTELLSTLNNTARISATGGINSDPTMDRKFNKASAALSALVYIYENMVRHYSGEYSDVYNDLQSYVMSLDRVIDTSQFEASQGLPSGFRTPQSVAAEAVKESREVDRKLAWQRQQNMPAQYTETLTTEDMPVVYRTARFLDADGTTRTEVYWSTPPDALALSRRTRGWLKDNGVNQAAANRYLLTLTAVQYSPSYERRSDETQHYLLERSEAVEEGTLDPQAFVVQGDTGMYHLALEWDQHLASYGGGQGGQVQLVAHLKTAVHYVDSLQALNSDRAALEMSDLKPLVLQDGEEPTDDALQHARLHPYLEVTPQTPLALYFEVYHLTYGPDDRTDYSIEYEVTRRTPEGVVRLFKRGEQRTSTAVRQQGRNRNVAEHIFVELGEWTEMEEDWLESDLTVVVRVTDEVTHQTVERPLRLLLVSESTTSN